MPSTNFTQDDISKINSLLDFVNDNQYSDFYKKRLGISRIDSYEDFLNIPFLLKDDIIGTDIRDRCFCDEKDIKFYSSSSGTTKNKKLTIIPHNSFSYPELKSPKDALIPEGGIKRNMILFGETSAAIIGHLFGNNRKDVINVIGNTKSLLISAKMAEQLEINAITTNPTILAEFAKELAKIGYDMSKLIWVSLGGEYCSRSSLDHFKRIFPNARFYFRYGNSEFHGKIGYRCESLENSHPSIYHINPSCILEIIDNDGNPVQENEYGEIVITDFLHKAFPLIRYRLGDVGKICKEPCGCGEGLVLEFSGRSGHDFLKLHGTVLRTETISQSLDGMDGFLEKRFEMHVYEKIGESRIQVQLQLNLKLKDGNEGLRDDDSFKNIISANISKGLYLASGSTLQDMIDRGIYLPLKIEFIEKWDNNLKSLSIIPHLD